MLTLCVRSVERKIDHCFDLVGVFVTQRPITLHLSPDMTDRNPPPNEGAATATSSPGETTTAIEEAPSDNVELGHKLAVVAAPGSADGVASPVRVEEYKDEMNEATPLQAGGGGERKAKKQRSTRLFGNFRRKKRPSATNVGSVST